MNGRGRLVVAILACVATLAMPTLANAQSDCHCDCYFSSDCESGNFCNWGTLSIEDSCWWRQPKPRGVIGAGCGDDFDDWGQCDGICSPSLLGEELVGAELTGDLTRGFELWARTLTGVSMRGGGLPQAADTREIDLIPFENPTMSIGLWRMVTEVLMLSRGQDYMVYPRDRQATILEIGVADLRDDSSRLRNGNLAVAAVLAEIREAGAGRAFLQGIDVSALDASTYERICDSGNALECLYERLAVIGEVLGRGSNRDVGGTAEAGGGPTCAACYADCVPTDDVNFQDLLELLAQWGSTARPCPDLDQDGNVNFRDLLDMLGQWGTCTE